MSYENPTTYVDTESSKYLAGAIAGVGQMTAKIVKDDIKRRADEAAENKLRTEKTTQAYKKYQLAGQNNVNLLSKDLNFSQNDNFRKGMSGVVDRLAKAKSAYEFSTDEDETKKLGDEIFKLDTFITKTFGGEMDDLQTDVMKMKDIMSKQGQQGGLDMYQDSNYTALLMQMAQGNEPEGLEFNFDPDTQDITMTVAGDQYKDGSYTMSLKGNQSMEIGEVPVVNLVTPTTKGQPSVFQSAGVLDDTGQIPVNSYSTQIGSSVTVGDTIYYQNKINNSAEESIKKTVGAEMAGLLNGGEGLAGGFKVTDAYYRNILLSNEQANGKFDKDGNLEVPPFLESGSHDIKDDDGNTLYSVPVTKESWETLVDLQSKKDIKTVNSMMPKLQKPKTKPPPTGYTKSQVQKGNYVNTNWTKNREKAATFLNTFNSGPDNKPPSSAKVLSDLQAMGIYATPLNVEDADGNSKVMGYELTNSASQISAKSRILLNSDLESQEAAIKLALGQEFALESEWESILPAAVPATGTVGDLDGLKTNS
jgi:hypothetical protein